MYISYRREPCDYLLLVNTIALEPSCLTKKLLQTFKIEEPSFIDTLTKSKKTTEQYCSLSIVYELQKHNCCMLTYLFSQH